MITINRPVRRITRAVERGEPLCVELNARTLTLWIKGTRQKFTVGYDSIYWGECKKAADEARLLKMRGKRR